MNASGPAEAHSGAGIPPLRGSSPPGAGGGEHPAVERLTERWGAPPDDLADELARRSAEAFEEVRAGLHAPHVLDGGVTHELRGGAGGPAWDERPVPVPEAVMALGWSHAWAWVCFAALTYRKGATVSAEQVGHVAGYSPGHARKLLAAIEAARPGLIERRARRWAPACRWRDITGHRDEAGAWRAPQHGRFQHHAVADLAGLDRAGRRCALLLAAMRLWCRQRRGDGPVPVYRRTLARWWGCSRRTIDRALRALADAGAVTVVGTPGGLLQQVHDST